MPPPVPPFSSPVSLLFKAFPLYFLFSDWISNPLAQLQKAIVTSRQPSILGLTPPPLLLSPTYSFAYTPNYQGLLALGSLPLPLPLQKPLSFQTSARTLGTHQRPPYHQCLPIYLAKSLLLPCQPTSGVIVSCQPIAALSPCPFLKPSSSSLTLPFHPSPALSTWPIQ